MEDLSKKTIFITGITGFTGVYLETFFLQKGYFVFGTSYQKSENKNHFICDITFKDQIKEILKNIQPDYIIHTAAISFVAGNNQEEMYKVNVFGTLNLLDALIDMEINPKKIIIASSAAVYGNIGEILKEDMCPSPINHYGNSKLAMENLVKTYFPKLNIIITRPFNYIGVGQRENFLIPKIISHFKNKKSFIELGNIDVYREFNDIDYLAECYYKLLIAKDTSMIINICSGNVYSIKNIISCLEGLSNHRINVKVNPEFIRKNEIKVLKGSPQKLYATIDDIPVRNKLEDTLERMFVS